MKTKRYSPTSIQIKEVNKKDFQIRFILSTPTVDRHGEIIDQKGWKLENYIKSPVVLWAHDQTLPAIGKMVDIGIVNGNLEGTVQFAYNENEDAAKIFELVAGEYINAGSVGFINDKWMYDETNDLLTLLENELLEFSIVNVPANADALQKAKAKGLDVEVVSRLNKGHEERFNNLGDEVKMEKKEEVKTEEKKPEEKPEEKKEETPAPEKTEPTDTEVKSALEVLCKSNTITIKDAVKELTSRLNASEADTKESKVDATPIEDRTKRYSNGDINRVIRSLLNGKERVA